MYSLKPLLPAEALQGPVSRVTVSTVLLGKLKEALKISRRSQEVRVNKLMQKLREISGTRQLFSGSWGGGSFRTSTLAENPPQTTSRNSTSTTPLPTTIGRSSLSTRSTSQAFNSEKTQAILEIRSAGTNFGAPNGDQSNGSTSITSAKDASPAGTAQSPQTNQHSLSIIHKHHRTCRRATKKS